MASMLEREPRLHARAALVGGLDDHCRERIPAHHRVAHRERCLRRRRAGQELRDDQALSRDLLVQRGILGRIHAIDARANDGDSAAARGERRRVRGGIDASRKAADDGNTSGGEPCSQVLGLGRGPVASPAGSRRRRPTWRRAHQSCRAGRAPEGAGGSSGGSTDTPGRGRRSSGSRRAPTAQDLPQPPASHPQARNRTASLGQAKHRQRLPARCRTPPAARSP